jgi:hypothetical protein
MVAAGATMIPQVAMNSVFLCVSKPTDFAKRLGTGLRKRQTKDDLQISMAPWLLTEMQQ